jgi:signal transduction histidine kinase
VLAVRGLAAALRARVRLAGGDVRVVPPMSDSSRFGADIELAVYFTCLDAMQNAAKHAPDAAVLIELSLTEGALCFSVTDEGEGFDPIAAKGHGTGLLGIADRIGSVGGLLTTDSGSGHGTTIRANVPVNPPQTTPPA